MFWRAKHEGEVRWGVEGDDTVRGVMREGGKMRECETVVGCGGCPVFNHGLWLRFSRWFPRCG